MTHDLELELPRLFFGGGAIRIEPKTFVEATDTEEEGAMVKIVFKPPTETEVGSGRFLHHISKFLQKQQPSGVGTWPVRFYDPSRFFWSVFPRKIQVKCVSRSWWFGAYQKL